MRIAILIPHNFSHFIKEFAFSVMQLQANFYAWQKTSGRDDELTILTQGGFHLATMRNKLVEEALRQDVDLMLFLDADQTFPPDMIQLMVEDFEDNPEIEAVTGIYTWKEPPYLPHIYRTFDHVTQKFMIAGGFPLDKLFQVEGAGTGCLMIHRSVFERTRKPWFKFGKYKDGPKLGEDLYFCYKAKPVMVCDPRIRSQHYRTGLVGVNDYLKSNGLKHKKTKKGESFQITKKQLDTIAKKHLSKSGHKEFDDFG